MNKDRLKYRIWDKKQKKFHYIEIGYLFFETDKCEQCTGIKDESGDLIYENDIVELDDNTEMVYAVIEWDNNAGCWNIRTSDKIYTFDNLYGNEIRVVGNIHQNPKLLENF